MKKSVHPAISEQNAERKRISDLVADAQTWDDARVLLERDKVVALAKETRRMSIATADLACRAVAEHGPFNNEFEHFVRARAALEMTLSLARLTRDGAALLAFAPPTSETDAAAFAQCAASVAADRSDFWAGLATAALGDYAPGKE